ncbi:baseplate assembly protein [Psychrobacter aquaticus]|uniref:Putative phage baseplate assembly protein n=1 Tax=Psychrobacter aquaticus CMS 56 TaxID=1354303 RepID=U4T7N3_9GAMM|nr:baseplate J/gp47 family protein [Psychrobacter aquaticus]ERL56126.1 putative phage baseplate assembly protein [Psychrobacter aquaticus CMS 56]
MTDISQLAPPEFIARDADVITAELIAEYEALSGKTLYPAQADRLMIDVIAYREMLIRTQINEAGKQNLIAFANGVMLDYLGDFFGVVRLDSENDEQLRKRIRLAPESYATTGSRQAYIFHALSTDASIIDCEAVRGNNGKVFIYILTADGNPSETLIQAVLDNTSDEKKRPLSDSVYVTAGEALDFKLVIKVTPLASANPQTVLARTVEKAESYVERLKIKLGQDVVSSQIINELNVDGVWQVNVILPAESLIVEPWQLANCTEILVTLGDAQNG